MLRGDFCALSIYTVLFCQISRVPDWPRPRNVSAIAVDYHLTPRFKSPTNTKLDIARGQRVPTATRFETWLQPFHRLCGFNYPCPRFLFQSFAIWSWREFSVALGLAACATPLSPSQRQGSLCLKCPVSADIEPSFKRVL